MHGVSTVEFALCFIAFLPLFFGAFEVARFASLRNVAAEATRQAARTVVMCSPGSATADLATARMRALLPQMPSDASSVVSIIGWRADQTTRCDPLTTACAYITVRLSGLEVPLVIPPLSLHFTLPAVSSTQPREFMNSTNNRYCS